MRSTLGPRLALRVQLRIMVPPFLVSHGQSPKVDIEWYNREERRVRPANQRMGCPPVTWKRAKRPQHTSLTFFRLRSARGKRLCVMVLGLLTALQQSYNVVDRSEVGG
ncbi:unnamed protein product [Polarella glacialis]|nr:unnamed protein product [Polarella glacialis]